MPKRIIPYYSYEDQLKIKISDKEIDINKAPENINILRLKNHSYYSLINGYKHHFLLPNETDKMIPNTSFEHFYACKMLEMDIGAIYLKYLLVIEQGFRTRVAHIIAREFSTDEEKYILEANYKNSNNLLSDVLNSMKAILERPNDNSYSWYFRKNNCSIPPWILLQDLDFYNVVSLYLCLPDKLRTEIRDDYLPTGQNIPQHNLNFSNSMHLLREYRNIFAHSKRNFKEKIKYSVKLSYFRIFPCNSINIPGNFDSSLNSKSLYTCTLFIIEYLKDTALINRFINDMFYLFIKDGYIGENFEGNPIFNGKTVYEILDLPKDFFQKITQTYQIKII